MRSGRSTAETRVRGGRDREERWHLASVPAGHHMQERMEHARRTCTFTVATSTTQCGRRALRSIQQSGQPVQRAGSIEVSEHGRGLGNVAPQHQQLAYRALHALRMSRVHPPLAVSRGMQPRSSSHDRQQPIILPCGSTYATSRDGVHGARFARASPHMPRRRVRVVKLGRRPRGWTPKPAHAAPDHIEYRGPQRDGSRPSVGEAPSHASSSSSASAASHFREGSAGV